MSNGGKGGGALSRPLWLGWIAFGVAGAATIGAVGWVMRPILGGALLAWAVGSVVTLLGICAWIGYTLPGHVRASGSNGALLDVAMAVTAIRAIALAMLAGFVLVWPRSDPSLWIPWTLYLVVAGGDAIDGALARARSAATQFGARFDNEVDALGILVGGLVGVFAGLVPVWYLLAGGLRYWFVAVRAARHLRGVPVYPLPPRESRRLLAAVQMGFLAVALLPITAGSSIRWLAALVLVPFALGFLRDWAYMTGRLDRTSRHAQQDPSLPVK